MRSGVGRNIDGEIPGAREYVRLPGFPVLFLFEAQDALTGRIEKRRYPPAKNGQISPQVIIGTGPSVVLQIQRIIGITSA